MHPTSSRPPRRPDGTRSGYRPHRTSRTLLAAFRIGYRPEPWKRGPVLTALALLLALVMLLHADIPDWRWNIGSLVETFLPWLGLLVPVLLAGALRRRS